MSQSPSPFKVDLSSLKSRAKDVSAATVEKVDTAGEIHGFIPRDGKGRPGRRPSPRTGQVHAKVFPEVAEEIALEATRRGVTQGVLIEEAWTLYRRERGL